LPSDLQLAINRHYTQNVFRQDLAAIQAWNAAYIARETKTELDAIARVLRMGEIKRKIGDIAGGKLTPRRNGAALGVKYTIDTNENVVIVTFSGEVVDADLQGIGAATKSHPLFDPSFSEIVDFSAVTGGTVSAGAVEILARRTSIYDPGSKHVVVAPQARAYGLSRMFQVFAEKTRPNTVVVHTMDEARQCLGLERRAG
jgi:hypothetical protein